MLYIPFFSRLLLRPELLSQSPFGVPESVWDPPLMLSALSLRFKGLEICPLVNGAVPRFDGRYSGVFFDEVMELSADRRGVEAPFSESYCAVGLNALTAVKTADVALTAVKPVALTAV